MSRPVLHVVALSIQAMWSPIEECRDDELCSVLSAAWCRLWTQLSGFDLATGEMTRIQSDYSIDRGWAGLPGGATEHNDMANGTASLENGSSTHDSSSITNPATQSTNPNGNNNTSLRRRRPWRVSSEEHDEDEYKRWSDSRRERWSFRRSWLDSHQNEEYYRPTGHANERTTGHTNERPSHSSNQSDCDAYIGGNPKLTVGKLQYMQRQLKDIQQSLDDDDDDPSDRWADVELCKYDDYDDEDLTSHEEADDEYEMEMKRLGHRPRAKANSRPSRPNNMASPTASSTSPTASYSGISNRIYNTFQGLPPGHIGPIDNRHLSDLNCRDQLKEGLEMHRDYILVNMLVADELYALYNSDVSPQQFPRYDRLPYDLYPSERIMWSLVCDSHDASMLSSTGIIPYDQWSNFASGFTGQKGPHMTSDLTPPPEVVYGTLILSEQQSLLALLHPIMRFMEAREYRIYAPGQRNKVELQHTQLQMPIAQLRRDHADWYGDQCLWTLHLCNEHGEWPLLLSSDDDSKVNSMASKSSTSTSSTSHQTNGVNGVNHHSSPNSTTISTAASLDAVSHAAWLAQLNAGDLVDAQDYNGRWLTAEIRHFVSDRKDSKTPDLKTDDVKDLCVEVHFRGYSSQFDECFAIQSGRLAKLGTRAPVRQVNEVNEFKEEKPKNWREHPEIRDTYMQIIQAAGNVSDVASIGMINSNNSGALVPYVGPGGAISSGAASSSGQGPSQTSSHTSQPPIHSSFKPGVVGLRSFGTTCFLNCTLQWLFHCPPVVQYFLLPSSLSSSDGADPFERIQDIATHLATGVTSSVAPAVAAAVGTTVPSSSSGHSEEKLVIAEAVSPPALPPAFLGDLVRDNVMAYGGRLAEAFARTMMHYWRGDRHGLIGTVPVISPHEFRKTVMECHEQFNNALQHDCVDFLNTLLDSLHEEVNLAKRNGKPAPLAPRSEEEQSKKSDMELAQDAIHDHTHFHRSTIHHSFQGLFRSTVECLQCHKKSTRFDPYLLLCVPIPEPEPEVQSSSLALPPAVGQTSQTSQSIPSAIPSTILKEPAIKISSNGVASSSSSDQPVFQLKIVYVPRLSNRATKSQSNGQGDTHSSSSTNNFSNDSALGTALTLALTIQAQVYTLFLSPTATVYYLLSRLIHHRQTDLGLSSDALSIPRPTQLCLALVIGCMVRRVFFSFDMIHKVWDETLKVESTALCLYAFEQDTPMQYQFSLGYMQVEPLDRILSLSPEDTLSNSSKSSESTNMVIDSGSSIPVKAQPVRLVPIPIAHQVGGYDGRRRKFFGMPHIVFVPAVAMAVVISSQSDQSMPLNPQEEAQGAHTKKLSSNILQLEVSRDALQRAIEQAVLAYVIDDDTQGAYDQLRIHFLQWPRQDKANDIDAAEFKCLGCSLGIGMGPDGDGPSATCPGCQSYLPVMNRSSCVPILLDTLTGQTNICIVFHWSEYKHYNVGRNIPGLNLPASPVKVNQTHQASQASQPFQINSSLTAMTQSSYPPPYVPVKPVLLTDCLEAFSKGELLTGSDRYRWRPCAKDCDAYKQIQLWSAPPILVIQLKRFKYNAAYEREKIYTKVVFPLDGLDIGLYMDQQSRSQQSSPQETKEEYLYDCMAIINHSGTTNGGHYTCYLKHLQTQEWYLYNDHRVEKMPDQASLVTHNAYVLVYQRRSDRRAPKSSTENKSAEKKVVSGLGNAIAKGLPNPIA